jgi:hypothetical protein
VDVNRKAESFRMYLKGKNVHASEDGKQGPRRLPHGGSLPPRSRYLDYSVCICCSSLRHFCIVVQFIDYERLTSPDQQRKGMIY